MVFLKEFFEKVDFEKIQQTTKKHAELPKMQRVITLKSLNPLTDIFKYLKTDRG